MRSFRLLRAGIFSLSLTFQRTVSEFVSDALFLVVPTVRLTCVQHVSHWHSLVFRVRVPFGLRSHAVDRMPQRILARGRFTTGDAPEVLRGSSARSIDRSRIWVGPDGLGIRVVDREGGDWTPQTLSPRFPLSTNQRSISRGWERHDRKGSSAGVEGPTSPLSPPQRSRPCEGGRGPSHVAKVSPFQTTLIQSGDPRKRPQVRPF